MTLGNLPPNSTDYSKNPELQDLGSLQELDILLAEMGQQGLYLRLDRHRLDCQAFSQLWYMDDYSAEAWIADLRVPGRSLQEA
ncbi:hypothetical protein U5801_26595 [Lamprobacter modestohalophilus]|uniref:hypothetical protein n=1 Tax=Lamprobacter modestohalophilus TaxID=1064514 RepID=UPI002ADEE603|nr:hypothetical protein [Lamprobacter modestohalophilus]MEA1053345.1 hypothetical protein [Lamprobacter modestohalophilus]